MASERRRGSAATAVDISRSSCWWCVLSLLASVGRRFLPGRDLAQAGVLFAARRAALEVLAHAGDLRVGVLAVELELDVLVEQLEAFVAADLRALGAEQAGKQVVGGHGSSLARSL